MSRDLKNEYEAMLDLEIPDLWSRIEPKLTEKTGKSRMSQTEGMQEAGMQAAGAQAYQTQTIQMQEAGTQTTDGQTERRKKSARRRPKRSTIAVFGSLAAACVCLALILPAWRGSEKGSDRLNQMASDTTNHVSADEAAKGETEENNGGMLFEMEPESSSAEAGSTDEDAMNFDASSDGTLSAQESISEDSAEAADGENNIAQSPQENGKETIEAPAEEEADQIEDASEPEPVYECRGEIVDAWQTQEGFFYRMELAENVDGFMPAGSEIVIFQKVRLSLAPDASAALMTGYSYRVIVEPEETTAADGENCYVLISYEEDGGSR